MKLIAAEKDDRRRSSGSQAAAQSPTIPAHPDGNSVVSPYGQTRRTMKVSDRCTEKIVVD
jgi:hypothetical protein